MNKKLFKLLPILIFSILLISCTSKDTDINTSPKNIIIEEKDKEIIRTYLNEKTENDLVENDDNCYSVFEVLGTERDKIYLWAYKENSSGSASSMPILLNATKENDLLLIDSHKIPGQGAFYDKDIKKIFPKEIQDKIFSNESTRNLKLKNELDKLKY